MAKKKTNHRVDRNVLIAIVLGLVVIEISAMRYGINGGLRTLIVSILALMAGIAIPYQKIIK